MKSRWFRVLPVLLLLWGCAVNPVTGRNELVLVPESTELKIGAEQYAPLRQMQGGDYVTHPGVVTYVRRVGQQLAAVSDRQLPYEFQVINDSTPNAWALPGGKIAINRGLLTELDSEAELAAVLGHEIVHAAARHSAQSMQRGMLLQGAVLAAGVAAGNSEYAGLALGGANVAAGLVQQRYSREAELEADYYGMQYMARAGYDPRAAIRLQETFVRLAEGRQTSWLEGLFASHPPSPERVAANRETAAALPSGGRLGAADYRQALAPLLSASDAYAAYDEGRKALAAGDLEQALAAADRAIRKEPAEALFYSLRGDVLRKQGREQQALAAYDRALERNPDYFHYALQRGLIRQSLGQQAAARSDLQRSLELLPTAPAHYALGRLARQRGDRSGARDHFNAAAQSESSVGQQAYADLVRMDLRERPDEFLKIDFALDGQGRLLARLSNPTPVAIDAIRLQVGYTDAAGRAHQARLAYAGPLAAGQSVRLATGLGPVSGSQDIRQLYGRVSTARVAE